MLLEIPFELLGAQAAWQLNALLRRQLPSIVLRVLQAWCQQSVPRKHFLQDLQSGGMLSVLAQPLNAALCSLVVFADQVLYVNLML